MANRLTINVYNEHDEKKLSVFYHDSADTTVAIGIINDLITEYANVMNRKHYKSVWRGIIEAFYACGASLNLREDDSPEKAKAFRKTMTQLCRGSFRLVYAKDPYNGFIDVLDAEMEYNEDIACGNVNLCITDSGKINVCMFGACTIGTYDSYCWINESTEQDIDQFVKIIGKYRNSKKTEEDVQELADTFYDQFGLCDCSDFVAPMNDPLVWYNPKERKWDTESFRLDANKHSASEFSYLSLDEINDDTIPFVDLTVFQVIS